MKKISLLLFGVFLLLSNLCVYPQSTENKNMPTEIKEENIDPIKLGLKKIENRYLKDRLSLKEEIQKLRSEYRQELNAFQNLIFGIFGIIAFILVFAGILSLFGLKKYLNIHTQLTETKNLFDIMAKSIYEKERELHTKFDEIIGKNREDYTTLDEANFLDYEHKLYFARAYLPITKKLNNYKLTLFILGEYWLEQKNPGRALLRLKEIEKLQTDLDSTKNYLSRILFSFGKKNFFQQRILGNKTAKYFNLCGCTYVACAKEEKKEKKKIEFFNDAIECYKKSIEINKNYSSPYYNLGRVYGYEKGKEQMALQWYKQAFNKTPDLSKETHRNITCCLIREKVPLQAILKELDNIPNNIPYWQEIIDDEFINPKIKATPRLRSFVLKKFPSAKNIT